jgi:hypothetical protein
MGIMLGELSVEQMERRMGIELTQEEKKFFEETYHCYAENIPEGKWHCFDIPFLIQCGGENFHKEVIKILSPYGDKMKTTLQVAY